MIGKVTIADLFCGAGGTSTGAMEAVERLGCEARLTAVNHWPVAVETHTLNHPEARHFCASLDALNPRDLFGEGELDVLWASPECTHHSTARGGKPINDQSRATAWCVVRWAEALRPGVILVENVPEFLTWGGIGADNRPLKSKKGATFIAWVSALESLGYRVGWRVLCAADYGDPTTRRRLFVQAVRGRRKVVWPEPTHGRAADADLFGDRRPWVPARDIIDWDLPGQSIFERARPLSPKTLARIEAGLRKFGLRPFVVPKNGGDSARVASVDRPLHTLTTEARGEGLVRPFLIKVNHADGDRIQSLDTPIGTVCGNRGEHALCEPFIISAGGPDCPARGVSQPVGTVLTRDHRAIVEPMLLPQGGGGAARPVDRPAPTIACDGAVGLVEPFLVSYYGNGEARSIVRPLVEIRGERYVLDVRFRMLQPHELAGAQGFRREYQFAGTKTEVVKQIGNAVPRRLARAIVLAAWGQRGDVAAFLEREAASA